MPIFDVNQTWLYRTVKFETLSNVDALNFNWYRKTIKEIKHARKEIKRKQTWENLGNTGKKLIICLWVTFYCYWLDFIWRTETRYKAFYPPNFQSFPIFPCFLRFKTFSHLLTWDVTCFWWNLRKRFIILYIKPCHTCSKSNLH